MKHFKKILFIADHSPGVSAALSKVLELARTLKASVTVMDVLPNYPNHYFTGDKDSDMARIHAELRKVRTEELTKLLASLKKRKTTPQTDILVREGTAHIEIISTAMKKGYDLVAKANHNDTRLANMLFGTLDMGLLRKCPCPVYIMKPRKKIRHSRILAAVDLIRPTKQESSLDKRIMELATSMMDIEQGTLDVIHAWHMPHEKRLRNDERIALAYKSVDALTRELRNAEKQHLEAIREQFPGHTMDTHLIKGAPETIIPRFAQSQRSDLVVMGSVARTGIAGFFIGNTAERILHGINTSILAIKPEGFKSPVK